MWSAIVVISSIICMADLECGGQSVYFRLDISDDMQDVATNSMEVRKDECNILSSAMVRTSFKSHDKVETIGTYRIEITLANKAISAVQNHDYAAFLQLFGEPLEGSAAAKYLYSHWETSLGLGQAKLLGVFELLDEHYYLYDVGSACKIWVPICISASGDPRLSLHGSHELFTTGPSIHFARGPESWKADEGEYLSFPYGTPSSQRAWTVFMRILQASEVRGHVNAVVGQLSALSNALRSNIDSSAMSALVDDCITAGSRSLFMSDCDAGGNNERRLHLSSMLQQYSCLLTTSLAANDVVVVDIHPHYIVIPMRKGRCVYTYELRRQAQYLNPQGLWDTGFVMCLYQVVNEKTVLTHMMASTDYTRLLNSPPFQSALEEFLLKRGLK